MTNKTNTSVNSEDAPAKDDICGEVHGGHSPDLSWAECDECSHEVYNNKQSNHELHLLCCECLKKIKQQAVEKALMERAERDIATCELYIKDHEKEIVEKAMGEFRQFCKNVERTDKTPPYNYPGGLGNTNVKDNAGEYPQKGERWMTPKEMAESRIKKIDARWPGAKELK